MKAQDSLFYADNQWLVVDPNHSIYAEVLRVFEKYGLSKDVTSWTSVVKLIIADFFPELRDTLKFKSDTDFFIAEIQKSEQRQLLVDSLNKVFKNSEGFEFYVALVDESALGK